MTIRHRITLLVILMFVALSIIGAFAVYRTRESAAEVRQVTQGVVPSALASADLVATVKDIELTTMTLVYAPDANTLSQAQDQLSKQESAMRDALDVQAKAAATHAQVGLVAQARQSMANYFSAISDTAKMKAAGNDTLAQANLFANVGQYSDELEGIVETLRIEKNRQKDDAISALNDSLATTTLAIAGATGAAILLLVAIGWMLYRQITQPLSSMQAMMSEIAASQDFTRRVPVGRMDEIGRSIVAFNEMIAKIEESAAQLKQKTADIQAMLQNMQQGILTVVDGAKIHAEYSAYLETIFETNEIAGQPLMALVFAQTDLSADALAQVDAAVEACIGEDAMNFEFNQHLLASEVNRTMPDGRVKTLDLSWSAITDEHDVVTRLMLCVRDVTELRRLTAEAGEQRSRLEMIGEILAVGQDKFQQFVESASGFISANERIITQHAQADHGALAELFRNMHTIKGNARTYSLRHLTGIVHETEQRYDALRQPDTDEAWDRDVLAADLERVKQAVDRYAELHESVLGKHAGASTSGVSGAERERLDESLRLIDAANPADLQALQAMRDEVRRRLALIGTESLAGMLSGLFASLPSLAQELDKEAPEVHVDDNGYRLRGEAGPTVRNVFMHLVRNSVDHGLEPAAERLAHGKAAAGRIDIEAGTDGGALQLTLSDDGRGLALGKIRERAIERGWLAPDAKASDEEIAELIFMPGFSTASQVTEVSGRGVGMDAVRDFLSRENGRIELRFTDTQQGAPYRRFQTIVHLPGRWAVDSLGTADPASSETQPDGALSSQI
ncbi:chemotaxis protein CheA [Burkholderia sp. WAC0059]|uniref:ATP-binding protein n=1 Tax=Burkholderia sp. WAC0059 TaxID=2066022 RepID=UPI000C7F4C0B|nr:ATP-binding protein [Burkholderia sp. WAC0059]PLZ02343.1 chemotaxis protein CheA [Burkholderia sp. WAC0059]